MTSSSSSSYPIPATGNDLVPRDSGRPDPLAPGRRLPASDPAPGGAAAPSKAARGARRFAFFGAGGLFLLASLPTALGAAGPPPRPMGAGGPVSHLLLPTATNLDGLQGAVYKTRVSIFNASTYDYSLRVGLRTQHGEISVQYVFIRSGLTLTFNNFVADVFGLAAAGAIDFDSGEADNLFLVNAQVYVDTGAGRYTTAVQPADDLGAITPFRPGLVVGFSVNADFRTNIGCASTTSSPQTVTFSVFNSSSRTKGLPFTLELEGLGWDQLILAVPITNGGLLIETTGSAVCYAVEVNNVSNDGTYLLAVPF